MAVLIKWAVLHVVLTNDSRNMSRRILTNSVELCVKTLRILLSFNQKKFQSGY